MLVEYLMMLVVVVVVVGEGLVEVEFQVVVVEEEL
jgi:hypothetical protein